MGRTLTTQHKYITYNPIMGRTLTTQHKYITYNPIMGRTLTTQHKYITSIPVRGRIKETARVDNLVIHPDDGWITSYPPVVRVDN